MGEFLFDDATDLSAADLGFSADPILSALPVPRLLSLDPSRLLARGLSPSLFSLLLLCTLPSPFSSPLVSRTNPLLLAGLSDSCWLPGIATDPWEGGREDGASWFSLVSVAAVEARE